MSATSPPDLTPAFRLRGRELSRWLCVGMLAAVNLLVIGVVAYCVVRRFGYPFELSWMEGCFVDHARRILDGRAIYCEPSEEFIALLYTPIGHYLTAGVMKLGLNGFQATRAVSLLSLLLTLVLCMWLASRATRHRWMCLTIPGLVAATYFSADGYYDVGRPDQPMMLFCALAVVALTLRSSITSVTAFVVCALLAFWTKQSVLIFFVVLLAMTFPVRRRVAIFGGLAFVLGLIATIAWAHFQTDGWFSFYVFKLPSHKMLVVNSLRMAIFEDFLRNLLPYTIALVVALAVPALAGKRDVGAPSGNHAYRILLAGATAAAAFSFVSRATVGGAQNVLILFAVFGATLLPVTIASAIDNYGHRLPRVVGWRTAMLAISLATIVGLRDYRPYVPGSDAVEIWRTFIADIEKLGSSDRTWIQNHGAVETSAGPLGDRPHAITVTDYLGGTGRRTGYGLPGKLPGLIRNRYFDVIVFPAGFGWMEHQVSPHYQRDPSRAPISLPEFSGWRIEHEEVWIRSTAG